MEADPARTRRQETAQSASTAVDALEVGDRDDDRCPSCDAHGAWRTSRRHRFSPFGTVTLVVLAFWVAVAGRLLGFGYMPSLALLMAGIGVGLATRTAEVCDACGYIRPRRRS